MPLTCQAWLCVPLNTDSLTQDNCCLLFMEGPSATLCTLRPSQKLQEKDKRTLVHLLYMYMHLLVCMPLWNQVQLKCVHVVQSWFPLFLHIVFVVCSASEGWRKHLVLLRHTCSNSHDRRSNIKVSSNSIALDNS